MNSAQERTLLILNQHYPPDLLPTGVAIRNLVRGLLPLGWRIRVLSGMPVALDQKAEPAPQQEKEGALEVVRYRIYRSRRSAGERVLHYMSYAISALSGSLAAPEGITLVLTTPPLLLLGIGALRKLLRGVPFLYWIQDLYPDLLKEIPSRSALLLYRTLLPPTRFLEAQAARIITLTEDMACTIKERGIPEERIRVLPNPVDLERVYPVLPEQNPLLTGTMDRQGFRVVYTGNLGFSADLPTLCQSLLLLRQDPLEFLIFSYGKGRADLEKFVEKEHLSRVRFYELLPEEEASYALCAGEVALALTKKNMLRYLVPAKIYGALAAGVPVIASAEEGTEIHRLLRQHQCGIPVPPEDPEALAKAIRMIMNMPLEQRREMGNRGRKFAEKELAIPRIAARFNEILGEVWEEHFLFKDQG